MAWTKGDLITASKLNSENTSKKTSYSNSDGWHETSTTSAWHFIHKTTGRIMSLQITGTGYWLAKGSGWFEFRNATGNVSRVAIWNGATNTSKTWSHTVNIQSYSYGPGWYRGYATQNRGNESVTVYWGQDNCWRGGKLVHWDSPTSSGNKIVGTKLTAEILNTGRVGVI